MAETLTQWVMVNGTQTSVTKHKAWCIVNIQHMFAIIINIKDSVEQTRANNSYYHQGKPWGCVCVLRWALALWAAQRKGELDQLQHSLASWTSCTATSELIPDTNKWKASLQMVLVKTALSPNYNFLGTSFIISLGDPSLCPLKGSLRLPKLTQHRSHFFVWSGK